LGIVKTFARLAVNQLARNPEVQAKVSEIVNREVLPRAKVELKKLEPKLVEAHLTFKAWTGRLKSEKDKK
jgi:hypothetical protein